MLNNAACTAMIAAARPRTATIDGPRKERHRRNAMTRAPITVAR